MPNPTAGIAFAQVPICTINSDGDRAMSGLGLFLYCSSAGRMVLVRVDQDAFTMRSTEGYCRSGS